MKRNSCGCGPSKPNMGGVSPYGMSPNMISPASAGPGMGPNMNPGMVSPASTGPLNPIVAPEQTIFKNFYHTATQPIVHPVNIVNQHHTIPVPQHFCSYNVKDVNCGVRNKRRGRR
ncbi:hypothetical protein MH117_15920 [Paenibacillus sp. ACRRX]|uniref:hypothetical protein n=1 Tax=unclassified Paenibacillus TaxID=185978 RepID=UPI001EF426AB|nr:MULTISPECIES: hypothetical protein [unclassified Paenibacillus]MCG7408905.1 hypothetical protein [Paenibacillus sp. ACRRX]MDK8182184.1 hypothetical protein [Paenibacillus sp. UMB4589-SE434]